MWNPLYVNAPYEASLVFPDLTVKSVPIPVRYATVEDAIKDRNRISHFIEETETHTK